MKEEMVKLGDVAEKVKKLSGIDISYHSIYRMITSGQIEFRKLTNKYYVPMSEVKKIAEGKLAKPTPTTKEVER